MKKISSFAAALLILFFAAPASAAEPAISQMGWSPENQKAINQWLESLAGEKPQTLLVLFDCDNTTWAGDIADSVVKSAVRNKIVSWKNAPVLVDYPFEKKSANGLDLTPLDYYEHLYDISPPLAYNYGAQIFAGLSLAQTDRAFHLATKDEGFPIPYAEIKELVRSLQSLGVEVGFASASPIFMVAPMIEHAGLNIPLRSLEGVDVYVRDPDGKDASMLLSNLIQSEGLTSWRDVIKRHARMVVTSRPSEILNARKGKSVGGYAIAARHVMHWNNVHKQARIDMNEMRLAGIFGDNFAPFSDLPGADSREGGNDQGLLRALPFIDRGGIVLNIYRAVEKDGALDLEKKKGNNDRFLALVKQAAPLYRGNIFINQIGISAGEGRGHFSRAELPANRQPQMQ